MTRKAALIIGGSRGLGRMAALSLAKSGYNIMINYKTSKSAVEELIVDLKAFGVAATGFIGDATDYVQMKLLFSEFKNTYGRLDVLVHSVGPFIRERKLYNQMTIDEIDGMVKGNLSSALYTTSLALPMMHQQKSGRIILFGFNRSGEAPAWPDRSVYAAAKVALVSFTKTLAVEEAPNGITVNMVSPSDIVGENKEKTIKEVMHIRDNESLRGRPGTGEDVARVINFLCQEESDFITGNIINISGGLDIIHPVSKHHFKEE